MWSFNCNRGSLILLQLQTQPGAATIPRAKGKVNIEQGLQLRLVDV